MKPEQHSHSYSPIESLLADVDALPVSEAAKRHFVDCLRGMAGQRVFFSKSILVRPARVSMAMRMLDQGMSRAAASARLSESLGISTSSSYRLIGRALHQRFMDSQRALFEEYDHG